MSVVRHPSSPPTVDEVLQDARKADLSSCVIIGEQDDDSLWCAFATDGDIPLAMYLLHLGLVVMTEAARGQVDVVHL